MTEGAEEGLWLCKYKGTDLPEELEHFYLAAYPSEPQNIRCRIVGQHTDPDGYLWGRCRMHLKLLDPGFFQEGAAKEKLRGVRAEELKWRNDSLEAFCESHNLDLSTFPPVPEETKIPKFANFGPKCTRRDRLLTKLGDIYPDILLAVIAEYLIIGLIIGLLLMLPFWPFSFVEKLLIIAAPAIFIILLICLNNYITCLGFLTKARSWPACCVSR